MVGRKRWHLFPPVVTEHIVEPKGDTIKDLENVNEADWPAWPIAHANMLVVEQEEGETIFV